ncbi:PAS domain S-box-containing protein/diguanylate cyclase (GGDEF) domain-containing protein [Pelagirhabdus alkalitolerans]|uniref:PAS domain S-box-containing protein/diguanylate cyclase (GGDEF) domain-containing protein n=1 Tax=Pelagirhabdus alkalitolerans TaxID=1612202 RepID=A0A1G6JVS5_9BACI|nr:EAL domain-containing protein [Pelagirhabdus alkalitolerans]SDC22807.1 PAS domain S-box-containing protein/diguanylate cyclase (GGDEF) domain-containing protein [Pelagirhabdus alkalitolerans]
METSRLTLDTIQHLVNDLPIPSFITSDQDIIIAYNDLVLKYLDKEKNLKGLALSTVLNQDSFLMTSKPSPISVHKQILEIEPSKNFHLVQFYDLTKQQTTEKKLGQLDRQLKSLFEHHPELIFTLNPSGYFINVNPEGEKLLGYAKEELYKLQYTDIVIEEDLHFTQPYFYDVLNQQVVDFTLRVRTKERFIRTLHITAVPIIEDQQVTGVIGIGRDITQTNAIQKQLQESEQRYRSIYDNNIDMIMSVDLEGRFTSINKVTQDMFQTDADQLIGTSFFPYISTDYYDHTEEHFNNAITGQATQYETVVINDEKQLFHLHVTLVPIMINGTITGIHCIAKDISDKKRLMNQLNQMAYTDYLTNLPNHYSFHRHVDKFIEQGSKSFAVMFIDLDRFKSINEALGHTVGNDVLIQTAHRLKSLLPRHANLFRYSGDEFIATFNPTTVDEVKGWAQEIVQAFRTPLQLSSDVEFLTPVSIGISFFPTDGSDTDTLVRRADAAVRLAKQNGKNQYQLFHSQIKEHHEQYFNIESHLLNAVEKNEFSLYYQPQLSLETEEVKGLEALIRWHSDKLGFVSPGDFIPMAEENGLIVDIGEWVIETACQQIAIWKQKGLDLYPISVNVSIRQFYHTNFLEHLKTTIEKTQIDPRYLEIEITESVASNTTLVLEILKKLKDIGVQIAIDDFGTGYSSLHYLKEFPIDYLKIDQSFVRDITTDEKDQSIVKTIIMLASNLGLKTIAEGCETEEELQFLKDHGCDLAQGYYYSKPVPADAFETWFKAWNDAL